jgi:hypothetical protein
MDRKIVNERTGQARGIVDERVSPARRIVSEPYEPGGVSAKVMVGGLAM